MPADYVRALALRAPGVLVDGSIARAWTLGEALGQGGGRAVRLNGLRAL